MLPEIIAIDFVKFIGDGILLTFKSVNNITKTKQKGEEAYGFPALPLPARRSLRAPRRSAARAAASATSAAAYADAAGSSGTDSTGIIIPPTGGGWDWGE